MQKITKKIILIIEDSVDDYFFIDQSLTSLNINNPTLHFDDGDKALEYLFDNNQSNPDSHNPLPSLILLDLNLPKTDGRAVLRKIKSDLFLKKVPTIIFTTSSDPKDIEECYRDGANSYIKKPDDLAGFKHILEQISTYWFDISALPEYDEY